MLGVLGKGVAGVEVDMTSSNFQNGSSVKPPWTVSINSRTS